MILNTYILVKGSKVFLFQIGNNDHTYKHKSLIIENVNNI